MHERVRMTGRIVEEGRRKGGRGSDVGRWVEGGIGKQEYVLEDREKKGEKFKHRKWEVKKEGREGESGRKGGRVREERREWQGGKEGVVGRR